MSVARSDQYQFRFSSYYLYTSRCVRGAYLCGIDPHSGQNCDHRCQWITEHLQQLAAVYCIQVEALRIRSSAYQVILRVDHADAAMLSNHEIVHRWCQLYRVPAPVKRYLDGVDALETDSVQINASCQSWRRHMTDVGKYVGHLNQTLSRRANLEDACSGRFWEPRTRLRPLANAAALGAALAVVRGEQIGARSRSVAQQRGAESVPEIKVA